MSSSVSNTNVNGKECTFIYNMVADGRSSGGGYTNTERKTSGTDIMRSIMESNLKNPKVAGRVYLDAKWGSHLFHLKMGAIPVEGNVEAQSMYGMYEIEEVKKFVNTNAWGIPCEASSWVRKVLANEMDQELKEISQETAKSHVTVFQQLLKVGVPALDSFAYRLGCCIESYKQKTPQNNWSMQGLSEFFKNSNPGLVSERMKMSDEGLARWKFSIESSTSFNSFRDLSPLISRIQRPSVKKKLLQAMKDLPGCETPSTKIRVHWDTKFGQTLMICGSGSNKLNWNPQNALAMTWTEGNNWVIDLGVIGQPISFKILLKEENGELKWMEGSNLEAKTNIAVSLSENEVKFQ